MENLDSLFKQYAALIEDQNKSYNKVLNYIKTDYMSKTKEEKELTLKFIKNKILTHKLKNNTVKFSVIAKKYRLNSTDITLKKCLEHLLTCGVNCDNIGNILTYKSLLGKTDENEAVININDIEISIIGKSDYIEMILNDLKSNKYAKKDNL